MSKVDRRILGTTVLPPRRRIRLGYFANRQRGHFTHACRKDNTVHSATLQIHRS